MRKVISFTILLVCLKSSVHAQDLQEIVDRIDLIVNDIHLSISSDSKCENLINKCENLQNEIDKVLKNGDRIHPDDIKNLKQAKRIAEDVESFIRVVGNTPYPANFLTDKQLFTIQQLYNFDMSEVYLNKFCVQVFEIKMGNYICVLIFKNGSKETYNTDTIIKSNKGKTTERIEMGLRANYYRRLWNNSEMQIDKNYMITSIKCT